jgi:hypothetical protein
MLLTLVMVILLAITAWVLPSNKDFAVENPFWNGTSNIHAKYSILAIHSFSDLPASPPGVTLILIPYLPCNHAEMEDLKQFVTRGGTLILADDYSHGYGNRILRYLGIATRFSGEPLLDPLLNYKNANFPKVNLDFKPLTEDASNLVLNHATCLINVAATDVIAMSSSFSFLDGNDSGRQEEDEPTGPLPVISNHIVGNGQVIIIADPSLFINSMESLDTNESFQSFMQHISDTSTKLYLDQYHLPQTELEQTKKILRSLRDFLSTPLVTSATVIMLLGILLKPIWYKRNGGI